MKATSAYPVLKGSNTVIRRPPLVEAQTEPVAAAAPKALALCLECRFAELYAEQPRARCRGADSVYTGKVVFAGQPACVAMKPRDEKDLRLAWCSRGLEGARARSEQPQSRAR